MKLSELEPELLVVEDAARFRMLPPGASVAEADGVWFVCPGCGNHHVRCWFANRPRVTPEMEPTPARWMASGSTLADLTLSPSVFFPPPGCGWHGYVTAGEVTTR